MIILALLITYLLSVLITYIALYVMSAEVCAIEGWELDQDDKDEIFEYSWFSIPFLLYAIYKFIKNYGDKID